MANAGKTVQVVAAGVDHQSSPAMPEIHQDREPRLVARPGKSLLIGYTEIPDLNLTQPDLPVVSGVMRHVAVAPVSRGFCVLAALLTPGLCAAVAATENPASPPQLDLLTNLFQLRGCAGQEPAVVHPFRIVAEVCDVDSASGVLVLRDPSGVEFIRLDLQGRTIEPGATVCLEGKGCGVKPKSFGLAVVPGMVVDNDGLHGITVESGAAFLHAGVNPITVQWFNRTGDFGLSVEYEGPGLPRQRIPGSVLSRANTNPATGTAKFPPDSIIGVTKAPGDTCRISGNSTR